MKLKKLWTLLVLVSCLQVAWAQSSGCNAGYCQNDSLLIRTGYDDANSTTYAAGQRDSQWKLVNAPSSVNIPSPAWVISPFGSWNSISANSQWISAFSSASFNVNNPAPQPPYAFETEFCTCDSDTVQINLQVMVDDIVEVFLDGVSLGSYTAGWYFLTANIININLQQYLPAGNHKLRFDVRNTGSVAMGLAVEGYILGAHNISSRCCNPNSSICGVKYHDLNQNGTRDSSSLEPTLSGWTIVLKDSLGNAIDSTVTDIFGEYCFTDVPPGHYQLCEVDKPLWVQYEPDSFYTIYVDTQEVITLNFGNWNCIQNPTDSINLNTGYDHANSTTYNTSNEEDDYWRVIKDPGSSFTYQALVRIPPPSAWSAAQANSRWIYPTIPNSQGYYEYERCFCLNEGFTNAILDLNLRADDSAIVYLNGNLIGTTTSSPPFNAFNVPVPFNFNTSNQSYFQVGQNCVVIKVYNAGGPTGLNVLGGVIADNYSVVHSCCDTSAQVYDPKGSICGIKYADLDCDGGVDPSDTTMANWTIYLKDALGNIIDSTVTDTSGSYCFDPLAPGSYIVSEKMQAGWVQSYPGGASQSHNITLGNSQNLTANFGNCVDSCFTQDQIIIGSGFDSRTQATLPVGVFDPAWTILNDPYGTSGAPAITITNPAWVAPVGGSQWVNSQPGTSHLPGWYSYQYCFCMKDGTINPVGGFEFRCDDSAVIYFNGVAITAVAPGTAFGGPPHVFNLPSGLFQPGINCIQVDVYNSAFGATGFSIFGGVSANSMRSFEFECCSGLFQVPVNGVLTPDGIPAELKQNAPNPFTAETHIEFYLPENSQTAVLKVFDLQGKEMVTYNLNRKGKGLVTIEAGSLPQGAYLYSLIVDGQLIKTRKMILTK